MIKYRKRIQAQLLKRANRLVLLVAGKRLSPWVALEHTGRRSGRCYRTPLVTFVVGDGFVFMLPYGPSVDWCRNIMASGRCTLIRRGQSIPLERPEIIAVGTAVLSALPAPVRFMASEHALLLHYRNHLTA